jgi:predicted DNA-binding antitoxin AbrB/MazE fold protein
MVIHAVYENGVFRPTEPVDLPENCEVKVLVDVANGTDAPKSPTSTLARLAALASEYPANPSLPSDLAQQHDHYLYGAPKRP